MENDISVSSRLRSGAETELSEGVAFTLSEQDAWVCFPEFVIKFFFF